MRNAWLLVMALGAVVACDDGGTDTDPVDDTTGMDDTMDTDRISMIAALTGDANAGMTVYADNCELCHGPDGTGGVGSDLTAELPGKSTEDVIEVVVDGEGSMAGFGDSLTDQQIADVVGYVIENYGS